MAQRFGKVQFSLLLGVACLFLLTSKVFAQASSQDYRGTAVPAIVEKEKATFDFSDQADPLSIPIQKLAIIFFVICGLICLTYFGLKRYIAWSRTATSKRRSVGVLDTIPLGGKRFVTVARIYDRVLVLGVGEDTITLLTELSEDEAVSQTKTTEKPKAKEHFLGLLSTLTRKRREPNKEISASVKIPQGETAIL